MFGEIQTQRLALRDLRIDDAPRIFEYRGHLEVSRFLSWGTDSQEAIHDYILGLPKKRLGTPGSWYQVAITLLPGAEMIGDCGFQVLESDPGRAEIGIALAPEFQGRGYAAEALRALLAYLLFTLGKHRVIASVDPRNVRSLRLLERVGMRKEAHRVRALWFKGEWVDDAEFAISPNEWHARKTEGNKSGE